MILSVLLAAWVFSLCVHAEESVPAENSLLELKGKVEGKCKKFYEPLRECHSKVISYSRDNSNSRDYTRLHTI